MTRCAVDPAAGWQGFNIEAMSSAGARRPTRGRGVGLRGQGAAILRFLAKAGNGRGREREGTCEQNS